MANSANVTTGKPMIGGAVHVAPKNTTLPTDPTTALDSAFADLGYMSDAGVTNDLSRSTTDIKAWGGDVVLTTQTEKKDEWKYTMIEAKNINVLKQVFGEENVSETGGVITIVSNSKELERNSWVFDMLLSEEYVKRVVLPDAQIVNVDTISYTDSAAVGYAVTLKAYPDESGNTHYEYISAGTGSV